MKRTFLTAMLILLVLLASGCSPSSELPNDEKTSYLIFGTRFQRIEGRDDLVFDIDTKNVFYLFAIDSDVGTQVGVGRGFFGEYLGKYGHKCKYIDGKLFEFKEVDGEIVYFSSVSP